MISWKGSTVFRINFGQGSDAQSLRERKKDWVKRAKDGHESSVQIHRDVDGDEERGRWYAIGVLKPSAC